MGPCMCSAVGAAVVSIDGMSSSFVENMHSTQLAQSQSQSQSVLGQPLLAPLYRWPGLDDPVEFNTNYNVCI
jgi:hypothetical protein